MTTPAEGNRRSRRAAAQENEVPEPSGPGTSLWSDHRWTTSAEMIDAGAANGTPVLRGRTFLTFAKDVRAVIWIVVVRVVRGSS